MPHDPDFTVRIVDANGDPDHTVAVVDGISGLNPSVGDVLQWDGSAWTNVPADTPGAHAASHAAGGGDAVTLTEAQVTSLVADLALKAPLASPVFTGVVRVPLGTAANAAINFGTAGTGFYSAGNDELDVTISGVKVAHFKASTLLFTGGVNHANIELRSATGLRNFLYSYVNNVETFRIDMGSAGAKIGADATQKIALWGVTPVVQPTAVADASGGAVIDSEARTALNALLLRMRAIGAIAA